jgi:hypothetical protein
MTSDDPPASAGMPPGAERRRKAPTIDLTATEIEGSAAQAAKEAPTAVGTQSSSDIANGPQPTEASNGQADSAPTRRKMWLYNTLSWPAIGAGAASGACIALLLQVANPFAAPRGVDVSALDARLARIEGALREVPLPSAGMDEKRFDELASRIGKLEGGVATLRPGSDVAAANRLSTIEGELRALAESVGILGRRSDEVATAARDARQRADATAATLADLTQKVTPSAADAAKRDKIEAELQTVLSRLAAVERAEKMVETELAKREGAENRDRSGRFALAATALDTAIEQGQPFTAELAAVKSLAPDGARLAPLEPLATTGVPTTAALARELSALIPSLTAAAGPPPRDVGFLEKLQANAEKLVRIRPLEDAAGSDPAAIVARIEVKASKGDLAGALADLESLPPSARAPADAWIRKVQSRSAAVEASRRLVADALAGLTK